MDPFRVAKKYVPHILIDALVDAATERMGEAGGKAFGSTWEVRIPQQRPGPLKGFMAYDPKPPYPRARRSRIGRPVDPKAGASPWRYPVCGRLLVSWGDAPHRPKKSRVGREEEIAQQFRNSLMTILGVCPLSQQIDDLRG